MNPGRGTAADKGAPERGPLPFQDRRIVSFGFRYGPPPNAGRGWSATKEYLIDVRERFPNPHKNPRLRALDGLHEDVQQAMVKDPGWGLAWLTLTLEVEKYLSAGAQTIWIGCYGGRHRSVYLADRIGREFGIPVEHRDREKKYRQRLKFGVERG